LDCALKRDAKTARAILATHIMDCVSFTLANAPTNLLWSNQPEQSRRRRLGSQAIASV
jgi:hypothetical protein